MGIVDRLRALVGSDRPAADAPAEDADAAVEEEQAIEAVEARLEAARNEALFAMTDTPGSVDD